MLHYIANHIKRKYDKMIVFHYSAFLYLINFFIFFIYAFIETERKHSLQIYALRLLQTVDASTSGSTGLNALVFMRLIYNNSGIFCCFRYLFIFVLKV